MREDGLCKAAMCSKCIVKSMTFFIWWNFRYIRVWL